MAKTDITTRGNSYIYFFADNSSLENSSLIWNGVGKEGSIDQQVSNDVFNYNLGQVFNMGAPGLSRFFEFK